MACKNCEGQRPPTQGERFVAFMADATAKFKKDVTVNKTIEAFQLTDGPLRPHLSAVGAVIAQTDLIDENGPTTVIRPRNFSCVFGASPNIELADQPTAAHGAATLVGPQYVVTATHLLAAVDALRIVFGYEIQPSKEAPSSLDDMLLRVFDQKVFEIESFASNGDIALCRLKKPVTDVTPVPINGHVPVIGDALSMIGYPFSLPKKVSMGGRITKVTPQTFNGTLDGTNGNSGSPVFAEDGSLIGILSRTVTDPAHAEHMVVDHRSKETEMIRITLMPPLPAN